MRLCTRSNNQAGLYRWRPRPKPDARHLRLHLIENELGPVLPHLELGLGRASREYHLGLDRPAIRPHAPGSGPNHSLPH